MINEMVASLEVIFSNKQTYDFNSISKVLRIHAELPNDEPAILKVYQKMNLEGTPNTSGGYAEMNIFNERWIKRMSLARSKYQWGWNLSSKYGGSILPNGMTLNGEFIMNEAKLEIDFCMNELHREFELPTDFFVG